MAKRSKLQKTGAQLDPSPSGSGSGVVSSMSIMPNVVSKTSGSSVGAGEVSKWVMIIAKFSNRCITV